MATQRLPRFVTEPEPVIVEAVRSIEPHLDTETIHAVLVDAIKLRPHRSRLAKLVQAAPDLLTSGRPEGPHAIERLIRALNEHGARRLRPPACGHCGTVRPLTGRDGDIRICESCQTRRRRAANPCTLCGSTDFAYRDRDGRARCQNHPPDGGVNPLVDLVKLIATHGIGLNHDQITTAVREAEPRTGGQRKLLCALQDVPTLLTGGGARGPAKTIALIQALHQRGAKGLVIPPCPRCGTEAVLSHVRDGLRCCKHCWKASRAQPCSRCGHVRPVEGRTSDGLPLCASCRPTQPLAQHPCSRCGQLRVITDRSDGEQLCPRCYQPPTATCATCGRRRPCRFADSVAPQCLTCYTRTRPREVCVRCGAERKVYHRTTNGEPVCSRCGRTRIACCVCARSRPIHGRTADGEPLCRTCWLKHPDARRPCTSCGALEVPYRAGACITCAARADLRDILTGAGGRMRPELEAVYTALARSKPRALLSWIHYEHARRAIFQAFAKGTGPITHAVLDRHGPSPVVDHLRAALTAGGALPNRDERLASLERWIDSALAEVGDVEERTVLRRYTTWHHLRRLRGAGHPVSEAQAAWVRTEVTAVTDLFTWLGEHGTSLKSATQDHLDAWLTEGSTMHRFVRGFLKWTGRRGHTTGLQVPHRGVEAAPHTIPEDQRWAAARRLIHDEDLDLVDRAAGLLVLFFAQQPGRILQLTTSHVHITENKVTLDLGPVPLDLPEPLDDLVRRLVDRRTGRAVTTPVTEPGWLFPGGRAGQPMSASNLTRRLRAIGVPARAARTTALIELAAELPSKVLSHLLGVHQSTADKWRREAGAPAAEYATDLTQRGTVISSWCNSWDV